MSEVQVSLTLPQEETLMHNLVKRKSMEAVSKESISKEQPPSAFRVVENSQRSASSGKKQCREKERERENEKDPPVVTATPASNNANGTVVREKVVAEPKNKLEEWMDGLGALEKHAMAVGHIDIECPILEKAWPVIDGTHGDFERKLKAFLVKMLNNSTKRKNTAIRKGLRKSFQMMIDETE